MKPDKNSMDYQLNLLALEEMEYPSGPWNYWKGPDEQFLWDDARQCFISKDEL